MKDRVGLGWRPELAAGILANLDRVDVVEVVADDYLHAANAKRRALRTLAVQVPVHLHSIGLGLASAAPVADERLDAVGRLVDEVRPELWSEHLAFVRGGRIEIGHLAAPPRNLATIDGAARNLARARATVGAAPLVENVATLIDPPGSVMNEGEWVTSILSASGCDLLLDLHNLHCNASNLRFSEKDFLDRIPAGRIASIHLAGGRRIRHDRILDDHLHDVADPVYALLVEAAARAPRPLTVILERDGRYPPIDALLAQLDRAREALAEGRRRSNSRARHLQFGQREGELRDSSGPTFVTSSRFEAFLTRIFVVEEARRHFLEQPAAATAAAGLSISECQALERIDRVGLDLVAISFEAKRSRLRLIEERRRRLWLSSLREVGRALSRIVMAHLSSSGART